MPARPAVLFVIAVALVLVVLLALLLILPSLQSTPAVPIRVTSFETMVPAAPSGPTIALLVMNVGTVSIVILGALWNGPPPVRIPFPEVTPNTPLGPGASAYNVVDLPEGNVSCGASYSLEFQGTYSSGGNFDFIVTAPISCVSSL